MDDLIFSIVYGNDLGAFQFGQNSGEITVADSAPLDFETTPTFQLSVKASDGELSAKATVTMNLKFVLGIINLTENSIRVYPNQVQDILNVKIDDSDQIEAIKILDLEGSVLYIDNSKSKESVINTSFLSSAVYLLYIKTNSGSLTRKVIME